MVHHAAMEAYPLATKAHPTWSHRGSTWSCMHLGAMDAHPAAMGAMDAQLGPYGLTLEPLRPASLASDANLWPQRLCRHHNQPAECCEGAEQLLRPRRDLATTAGALAQQASVKHVLVVFVLFFVHTV
jgi:hypothetical protein